MTDLNEKLKLTHSWGINWIKNATEEGGAQSYVIKNRKQGEVVIKTWTTKYGQMWSSCTSDKLCNLIKKNCGILEIIADFPHKLYFDIDCKNPVIGEPILETIMQQIKSIWKNGDWAISGSIVDGVKESYHIVSTLYVIHNEHEQEMVKCAVKHLQSLNDAFDWKVYNKNRAMKCINQSKTDGRVQEIIALQDFRSHLICSYLPPYPEPIDCHFDEPMKDRIEVSKSANKFNLADLPKMNLQVPPKLDWFKITTLDLLHALPINSEFDHRYTHRVARFCFYNGITFEDFIEWLKPKHNDADNTKKWLVHWNKLDKFPPVSCEQMKPLLANFYPSIKRDPYFKAFASQFDMPDYVVKTHIDRLSQDHYNPDYKATILHLTMGSGKTAQTIDFLGNSIGGFCWIAHNKALLAGTLTRISTAEIDCKSYLNFDAKAKKAGCLNSVKNIVICANSLHYLSDTKTYGTLVIDEIESVVEAFIGDFMKLKSECWTIFKNLILNCRKLILIDAFITMKTINLIRLIDPHCTINMVLQSNITPTKTLIFKNTTRGDVGEPPVMATDTLSMAIHEIAEYINSGKRVFVFYPYKGQSATHLSMEQVQRIIVSKTNCKTEIYNADVDDKIKDGLKDVNSTWNTLDCVICNGVITCGVNFDLTGFDKVFMFMAPFITPRQGIQVSARIRSLTTNEIIVYYLGRQINCESANKDFEAMGNCPVYKRLYKDSKIENEAPLKKSFEYFCMKAPYKMEISKVMIDRSITKEIEKLAEDGYEYTFDKVEDIHAPTAEIIQERVMQQEASLYEKLQLKKFFFRSQFLDGCDDETLSTVWNCNLFKMVN
jgi:hypothetical protein